VVRPGRDRDQLAAAARQRGDQLEGKRDEGHDRRREHRDQGVDREGQPAAPRAGTQPPGPRLASEVLVEGE
jgi:hypothetical protein